MILYTCKHSKLLRKEIVSIFRRLSSRSLDPGDLVPKQANPKSKPLEAPKQSIILNENDIIETYCRGSGPGGQSVNKTSNKVQLTHIPLQLTVSCHETRSLDQNRKLARRKLVEVMDAMINKDDSKKMKKVRKLQKRKAKANRCA